MNYDIDVLNQWGHAARLIYLWEGDTLGECREQTEPPQVEWPEWL